MSELLEKILYNININAAYKRVCANKGTSEVDECSQGDFHKGVLATRQKHLLFTKNERKSRIIRSASRHPSANADTLTKISLF